MAKPGRSLPEVRETVPDRLKPVFDELVTDYRTSSSELVGQAFASYVILADLIHKGWRKPEKIQNSN